MTAPFWAFSRTLEGDLGIQFPHLRCGEERETGTGDNCMEPAARSQVGPAQMQKAFSGVVDPRELSQLAAGALCSPGAWCVSTVGRSSLLIESRWAAAWNAKWNDRWKKMGPAMDRRERILTVGASLWPAKLISAGTFMYLRLRQRHTGHSNCSSNVSAQRTPEPQFRCQGRAFGIICGHAPLFDVSSCFCRRL